MAWFGGSDPVAGLEAKIEEATSESIPNGELDVAIALEITDDIRSKIVQPKQAMRCLKKRLTKVYSNPNLLASTLKLCDMCVKNGGSHFLVELNSKEFISYLVDVIFKVNYDTKNYKVYSYEASLKTGEMILVLLQEWAAYFRNSGKDSYLDKAFTSLKNQGYEFPPLDPLINDVAANFVDSQAPPDWIDGKECMICYTPFSVMNRKHHCRACGGVFCQTHSSRSTPLVSLGILIPVRVCDDCNQINKSAGTSKSLKTRSLPRKTTDSSNTRENEDEDLKRAIELSLKDALAQASYVTPSNPPPIASTVNSEEVTDYELKAAIKASLGDCKEAEPATNGQPFAQVHEPDLEFYLNLMSFDASAYSQALVSCSAPDHDPQRPRNTALGAQHQLYGVNSAQPSVNPVNTPQEHLTEQDEDDINAFVQLMNEVKIDRFKQANILHDQNLNETYGKVVRLKPKLNRSLRDAIDKYELFLEMNSKINTITRLYDEYLENMLTSAYNKHSIAQPAKYYDSPYPASQEMIRSPTETLGPSNPGLKLGHQRQRDYFQYSLTTGQQEAYWDQSNDHLNHKNSRNLFPELYRREPAIPYSVSDLSPSELNLRGAYSRRRSGSMYPVDTRAYPSIPSPAENSHERNAAAAPQFTGSYPQEPSSPPEDDSDVDETESLSNRFPPLGDLYATEGSAEDYPKREHASMRFPSLSNIEQVNIVGNESKPATNFKVDPEPLIEL